jgi:hypothetical protein
VCHGQYHCSSYHRKERTYHFRNGLASKYYKIKVIKLEAVGHINLKNNPYIIRLKKENEEISDLLKLKPEELLLRWFNYHLKNAGHDR